MHEATIAASLLKIVLNFAGNVEAKRIAVIEVAVGQLRAVEAELLSSCFGYLAEGTICEGAELVIRKVSVTGLCSGCNKTSLIRRYRMKCEHCSGSALSILTGRELKVERVLAHSEMTN